MKLSNMVKSKAAKIFVAVAAVSPAVLVPAFATATPTPVLSSIVTTTMLNGVLAEVISLLPVVFPVSIGFMAIRKGIGFVLGMMRSA